LNKRIVSRGKEGNSSKQQQRGREVFATGRKTRRGFPGGVKKKRGQERGYDHHLGRLFSGELIDSTITPPNKKGGGGML